MNTRESMDAALKSIVIPELRNMGYKGSFPHFRRIGKQVDLITFQFDRYGGGFVIEVAHGSPDGFTTHWGKFIPAEKLRAWDLHPDERTRLQPHSGSGTDSWFRFDSVMTCDSVAHAAMAEIAEYEAEQGAAANP